MARDQRRLAAIVLADVVCYCRLMVHDESRTLGALKAHRRELINPKHVDRANVPRQPRSRHFMRPRTLVGLVFLLAAAAAGPPIDAQPATRIPKVAFLATTNQVTLAANVAAFKQGLRELGYVEGKTVVLEVRFAEGATERLPQLARELVALKPDVIVATIDPAIAAVRRETQSVPIVMAFSSDPAGAGFVASLARPGGNVTGLSILSPQVSGKRLE